MREPGEWRWSAQTRFAVITGGTSGIELDAAKRWCLDLWFLSRVGWIKRPGASV